MKNTSLAFSNSAQVTNANTECRINWGKITHYSRYIELEITLLQKAVYEGRQDFVRALMEFGFVAISIYVNAS